MSDSFNPLNEKYLVRFQETFDAKCDVLLEDGKKLSEVVECTALSGVPVPCVRITPTQHTFIAMMRRKGTITDFSKIHVKYNIMTMKGARGGDEMHVSLDYYKEGPTGDFDTHLPCPTFTSIMPVRLGSSVCSFMHPDALKGVRGLNLSEYSKPNCYDAQFACPLSVVSDCESDEFNDFVVEHLKGLVLFCRRVNAAYFHGMVQTYSKEYKKKNDLTSCVPHSSIATALSGMKAFASPAALGSSLAILQNTFAQLAYARTNSPLLGMLLADSVVRGDNDGAHSSGLLLRGKAPVMSPRAQDIDLAGEDPECQVLLDRYPPLKKKKTEGSNSSAEVQCKLMRNSILHHFASKTERAKGRYVAVHDCLTPTQMLSVAKASTDFRRTAMCVMEFTPPGIGLTKDVVPVNLPQQYVSFFVRNVHLLGSIRDLQDPTKGSPSTMSSSVECEEDDFTEEERRQIEASIAASEARDVYPEKATAAALPSVAPSDVDITTVCDEEDYDALSDV